MQKFVRTQTTTCKDTQSKFACTHQQISPMFLPRINVGAEPTIKSVIQSKEIMEKWHLVVSRYMITPFIQFNSVTSR